MGTAFQNGDTLQTLQLRDHGESGKAQFGWPPHNRIRFNALDDADRRGPVRRLNRAAARCCALFAQPTCRFAHSSNF
jgi:hypothetical protein